MITATIVFASVALGVAYTCAWLFAPRLRGQIEQPKHWFQDQVQKYDRELGRVAMKTDDTRYGD